MTLFNSISSISSPTSISKQSLIENVDSKTVGNSGNSSVCLGGFDGCGGCGGFGGFNGSQGRGGCGGSNFNFINIDIDIGRRLRCGICVEPLVNWILDVEFDQEYCDKEYKTNFVDHSIIKAK
ncbi:hypothetical protein ACTFIU_006522 [Dictyostelium citrinum]